MCIFIMEMPPKGPEIHSITFSRLEYKNIGDFFVYGKDLFRQVVRHGY